MAILLGSQPLTGLGDLTAANDSTAAWIPGQVIVDAVGNKYVYCLFEYTSTAGDAVAVDFTATENAGTNVPATGNTYSMLQPATATLTNFFGIALGAVTAENYGWVQVSGYNQVALASTTVTAGKFSVVANASSAIVDGTSSQGTAPQYPFWCMPIVSRSSAVPAIGTVFIYGMGAVLS